MQCTRCQGGFIALLYDELKCLNCGHRPKPLRPHEIKERRALETVVVLTNPPRCSRCTQPVEPGRKMCRRHLTLALRYVRESKQRHQEMFSTAFLTPVVLHVTQTIQGV